MSKDLRTAEKTPVPQASGAGPSAAPAAAPDAGVLMVVGVSHRDAPIAVRESLAFGKDELPSAVALFLRETGVSEVMILSTCNRVEVYARGPRASVDAVAALLRAHGRGTSNLEAFLYRLTGEEAVRHAFRVASGLDSMVVGEPQILGQLKDAYEVAEKAKTLGSGLGALRQRSLAAAKRVRTDTGIGRHAVSVSHVAVELARKIFGTLQGKNVLLVGAGKMSRLAASRLVRDGARAVVLGRTLSRAEELAAFLGGHAREMSELGAELSRADIVIASTGAPGIVVEKAHVEAARQSRGGRPLFLIDIAVPRDIDPAARDLSGVFLYDLDDLKKVSDANLRERQREASTAETLAATEAQAFLDWQKSQQAVPMLVALRQRAEEIRRAEIEKARRRMGELTADQEQALDAVTSAIVNKILHAPTVHLKELARQGQDPQQGELVRRILGIS